MRTFSTRKILSAIVEIKVPVASYRRDRPVGARGRDSIDSVVALGVGTRCDENGEEHVVGPILERLGYRLERAKTNTGLGRITNIDAKPAKVGWLFHDQHFASLRKRRELSR